MASVNGPNTPGGPTSNSSSQLSSSLGANAQSLNNANAAGPSGANSGQQGSQQPQTPNTILTRKCLQELVKQVDPNEQLDEDVEDLLLGYADEFFEQIVEGACTIAAHRKASAVEVKDLQTYLERNLSMYVPGVGSEEPKPFKRAPVTDAHKQRMALIKKQLKKY